MTEEREMKVIIENMETLAVQESIGPETFRKLLDKMFTSNSWGRFLDLLDKRGYNSIQVQENLREYFTEMLKRYFKGRFDIGTFTVDPYEYAAMAANAKGLPETNPPNSAGIVNRQRWDAFFDKFLSMDRPEYERLMFRYDLDGPSVAATLKQGFYMIVKKYFGQGGRVPTRSIGEKKMDEESISLSKVNRIVEAMLWSPRVERLLASEGVDEAGVAELSNALIPVLKMFFSSKGVGVQGTTAAKTAIRDLGRSGFGAE